MMQLPCAFLLCEGIFMMHRYNQSSDYDKTKIQPYHDMAVRFRVCEYKIYEKVFPYSETYEIYGFFAQLYE